MSALNTCANGGIILERNPCHPALQISRVLCFAVLALKKVCQLRKVLCAKLTLEGLCPSGLRLAAQIHPDKRSAHQKLRKYRYPAYMQRGLCDLGLVTTHLDLSAAKNSQILVASSFCESIRTNRSYSSLSREELPVSEIAEGGNPLVRRDALTCRDSRGTLFLRGRQRFGTRVCILRWSSPPKNILPRLLLRMTKPSRDIFARLDPAADLAS